PDRRPGLGVGCPRVRRRLLRRQGRRLVGRTDGAWIDVADRHALALRFHMNRGGVVGEGYVDLPRCVALDGIAPEEGRRRDFRWKNRFFRRVVDRDESWLRGAQSRRGYKADDQDTCR